LVLECGGDETQAIVALLHDSAEDCGGRPMLDAVRLMFGDDVARIVESCTDTFDDPKPTWRPRKEAYLKAMTTKPASAKLVACADKPLSESATPSISHAIDLIKAENEQAVIPHLLALGQQIMPFLRLLERELELGLPLAEIQQRMLDREHEIQDSRQA